MSTTDRRSRGTRLIGEERQRQLRMGFTRAHDAEHGPVELLRAAIAHLERNPAVWPWALETFRPSPDNDERSDVKAGALVAAALEQIVASLNAEPAAA